MNEETNKDRNYLRTLANQFMVMSQKGTVCFYEETVVEDLVDYFIADEKIPVALDLIEWGIHFHPFSSQMIYIKAELLYLNKEYAGALYELDNAVSLNPSDTNSFLLKARILIEMGRYDAAKETLNSMGKLDGSDMSNVHLCFATIYENLDRHDDMFNALCRALEADLDNEDILERLGLCTEFCLKHQEHILFLEKYLDERPYSSIAWYNLGHSYWYTKDYENAITSFEYAFVIDKFFYQAYLDCAEVLIKVGKYQVALSYYEDALVFWPKDGELYTGKGQCLYIMKDYTNALLSFNEAAYYAPDNPESFYGKGLCFMEMTSPMQALEAFNKASRLDCRREEYAAAMGEAYYLMGDITAASDAFNKAIELAPEISEYWIRNITFLMDENRFEEAFDNIQAAFANTFGTELKYCHAAYCFRTGNRQEGLSVLQQAMDENYNMHSSLLELCPDLGNDTEVMGLIATYRPL